MVIFKTNGLKAATMAKKIAQKATLISLLLNGLAYCNTFLKEDDFKTLIWLI
jgi:hypothetical protein